MPLYEYECDACGHRVEIIQKFSDAPLDKCPKCGGPVHKLMSSPAIQFKGTGWYITDYAKKGSGGDGSKTESSSSTKGDTAKKSETKSETTTSDKTSGDKTTTESKPAKTASKD
jgi:putative FmdB family regulatory protein